VNWDEYFLTECGFDVDWCGWSNVGGLRDAFDWIANQGATPSEGTGPEVDHTTSSPGGTSSSYARQTKKIFL
jgi:hypothetical protein